MSYQQVNYSTYYSGKTDICTGILKSLILTNTPSKPHNVLVDALASIFFFLLLERISIKVHFRQADRKS